MEGINYEETFKPVVIFASIIFIAHMDYNFTKQMLKLYFSI